MHTPCNERINEENNKIHPLKQTCIAPENRPSQRELAFQQAIFSCELLVSGKVNETKRHIITLTARLKQPKLIRFSMKNCIELRVHQRRGKQSVGGTGSNREHEGPTETTAKDIMSNGLFLCLFNVVSKST